MNNRNSLSKPKREFCIGGPIPPEGYYVLKESPEIGNIIEISTGRLAGSFTLRLG